MSAKNINYSYPILDMQKIDNVSLLMQKVNDGNVAESYGATIEEFYESYANTVNVYGKAGKNFSGGLKLDFKESTEESTYQYFYKLSYNFTSFYIHITNTVDELREYLSSNFKKDLETMSTEALFNRYGTHLIKEASMGGRIEKSVTYHSTSNSSKESIDAAVNAHVKKQALSINGEISGEVETGLSSVGVEYTTNIRQSGGSSVGIVGNYNQWAKSFDETLSNATLCGIVGDNSLVGIWELLPEENVARRQELENAFIEMSGNAYEDLCEKYKPPVRYDPVKQSWYWGDAFKVFLWEGSAPLKGRVWSGFKEYEALGYNKIRINYNFYASTTTSLFGSLKATLQFVLTNNDTNEAMDSPLQHWEKTPSEKGSWMSGTLTTDLRHFANTNKICMIFWTEHVTETITISKVTLEVELYRE